MNALLSEFIRKYFRFIKHYARENWLWIIRRIHKYLGILSVNYCN